METAQAGIFSDPPILTESKQRTTCDACGETLSPTVMHKCVGNIHWHTENAQGDVLADGVVKLSE